MTSVTKISRAIISVSDKTGIVDLARKLSALGVEILSTGGTHKAIADSGIKVATIDSYTGFPEIMDGRVKTLHPKVHGGLLAIRDNKNHIAQAAANGITFIDMVIVNLYPFRETIAKPGIAIEEAIENIDIGGPTMLRSAAKNHAFVTVVVDPADYAIIIEELSLTGGVSLQTRRQLALKAFRHTADYDAAIDTYLSKAFLNEPVLHLAARGGQRLRYGENPHQSAVFYPDLAIKEASLGRATQLHGKELSYNNIVDGDAALEAAKEVASLPAAVVVKHMNPCGFATGATIEEALIQAWWGDPVSAYGSVIALTRTVDLKTAEFLKGKFVEILIAPDFDPDALELLRQKSKDIRLLAVGPIDTGSDQKIIVKHVIGGYLTQDRDSADVDKWECVTTAPFSSDREALARFSWKVCKHVKSNAIILAQQYGPGKFRLAGMGPGQPNRVDSLRRLAVPRAQENLALDNSETAQHEFGKLVMASDAFFPFADTIDEAHKCGIQYIVQPGGSKRDAEVIDACNKYGIAMVFTGMRHFRH